MSMIKIKENHHLNFDYVVSLSLVERDEKGMKFHQVIAQMINGSLLMLMESNIREKSENEYERLLKEIEEKDK